MVVDEGRAEGHASAHVAEGVVAHDADVANRHLEFPLGRAKLIRQSSDILTEGFDLLGLAGDDLYEGGPAVGRGEHGVLAFHAARPHGKGHREHQGDQGDGTDDDHARLRIPGHRCSLVGHGPRPAPLLFGA